MGTVYFPLVNVRKDATNTWHMNHFVDSTAEEITVPSSPNKYGFYSVFLVEKPDNGSLPNVTSRPLIEGYTEYVGYPLNEDNELVLGRYEFYVNYETGEIIFHPGAKREILNVEYWGKGSVIESDDINYLYDSIKQLYNIVNVSFRSFTINGSSTIKLPIQTSYPSNGTLVFKYDLPEMIGIKSNSIKITDMSNDTVLFTGSLNNDAPVTVPYSKLTPESEKTVEFRITAETENGITLSKSAYIEWIPVTYYGCLNTKLTDTEKLDITKLTVIRNDQFDGYINVNDNYLVVLVPSTSPEPRSIYDSATNLSIAFNDPLSKFIASDTGKFLLYYVYQSTYAIPSGTKLIMELD